jgi:hypothetical protein
MRYWIPASAGMTITPLGWSEMKHIQECVSKTILPTFSVMPAQAGIQVHQCFLDSRFRGNDAYSRLGVPVMEHSTDTLSG